MALLLNVPYKEKDEAKALGVIWHPVLKKWYVKYRKDYLKFVKWMPCDGVDFIIALDRVYLIEGLKRCQKCGNLTRVINFGLDACMWCTTDENSGKLECEYCNKYDDLHMFVPSENWSTIPDYIKEYIVKNYNFKPKYSNFKKTTYLANCCDYCDALQGDNYVYYEVYKPFCIYSEEDAAELTLYEIPLQYDIIVNSGVTLSSTDEIIKENAKLKKLIGLCSKT